MSIKFNEIEHIRKNEKLINLTGEIDYKHGKFLIKLENNIYIQADNYSEMGNNIEESLNISLQEEIISIKTYIITEDFVVIEIKVEL